MKLHIFLLLFFLLQAATEPHYDVILRLSWCLQASSSSSLSSIGVVCCLPCSKVEVDDRWSCDLPHRRTRAHICSLSLISQLIFHTRLFEMVGLHARSRKRALPYMDVTSKYSFLENFHLKNQYSVYFFFKFNLIVK